MYTGMYCDVLRHTMFMNIHISISQYQPIKNRYKVVQQYQGCIGERCHVNWTKVPRERKKGAMWTGERFHVNRRKASCEQFNMQNVLCTSQYIPVCRSIYQYILWLSKYILCIYLGMLGNAGFRGAPKKEAALGTRRRRKADLAWFEVKCGCDRCVYVCASMYQYVPLYTKLT
jgi:hypothetical protein